MALALNINADKPYSDVFSLKSIFRITYIFYSCLPHIFMKAWTRYSYKTQNIH